MQFLFEVAKAAHGLCGDGVFRKRAMCGNEPSVTLLSDPQTHRASSLFALRRGVSARTAPRAAEWMAEAGSAAMRVSVSLTV